MKKQIAVTYSKTDIAEMIRDAKSVCKANQMRPTEGNLRRIIADEHGAATAEQVFGRKLSMGERYADAVAAAEADDNTLAANAPRVLGGFTKSSKPAKVGGKKITVSDLQNTVNQTEKKMKKTEKAKPAAKAKAPAKRKLKLVLGFPVVAVARAFGKAGFMPAEAVAAIHTVEPKASINAIRTFVQAGRHGVRGVPAPLSKKQLKALVPASA
jgi:hypothetical protein